MTIVQIENVSDRHGKGFRWYIYSAKEMPSARALPIAEEERRERKA